MAETLQEDLQVVSDFLAEQGHAEMARRLRRHIRPLPVIVQLAPVAWENTGYLFALDSRNNIWRYNYTTGWQLYGGPGEWDYTEAGLIMPSLPTPPDSIRNRIADHGETEPPPGPRPPRPAPSPEDGIKRNA